MNIVIVGGGRLGTYLANIMTDHKHKVIVIDKDSIAVERLKKEVKGTVVYGDGCSPDVLRKAGVLKADIVVAATGDDEDNLIICQLAKFEYEVPKVVSKINNPKNEWLFTKDMGVDAAVSGARIIARLIEEETEVSRLTTVLNLAEGRISLVRDVVDKDAIAVNKLIKDLGIPSDCILMILIRDNKVLFPDGNTTILPGDEIISIVSNDNKEALEKLFNS